MWFFDVVARLRRSIEWRRIWVPSCDVSWLSFEGTSFFLPSSHSLLMMIFEKKRLHNFLHNMFPSSLFFGSPQLSASSSRFFIQASLSCLITIDKRWCTVSLTMLTSYSTDLYSSFHGSLMREIFERETLLHNFASSSDTHDTHTYWKNPRNQLIQLCHDSQSAVE